MQSIRPSIRCILTAFDETPFLKFIQQRNQLARQDGQAASQLLRRGLAVQGGTTPFMRA